MKWTVKIGRIERLVEDIEEASRFYCEERNKSGKGALTWPNGTVSNEQGMVYHIGYTGKVWADKALTGLIYSPYPDLAVAEWKSLKKRHPELQAVARQIADETHKAVNTKAKQHGKQGRNTAGILLELVIGELKGRA